VTPLLVTSGGREDYTSLLREGTVLAHVPLGTSIRFWPSVGDLDYVYFTTGSLYKNTALLSKHCNESFHCFLGSSSPFPGNLKRNVREYCYFDISAAVVLDSC